MRARPRRAGPVAGAGRARRTLPRCRPRAARRRAISMDRDLDDQSFLAEVSELVGQRLSAGAPARAEEFVSARPHLRAQILETLRVAERRASEPVAVPEVSGYRIERELGRGAMGTVYLARQLAL